MTARFLIRGAFILSLQAALLMGCKTQPDRSEASTKAGAPSAVKQPVVDPTVAPDEEELLKRAATKPSAPFAGEGWKPLFDGKTLTGWQETLFGGHGGVECNSGMIVMNMGDQLTGINWTNDVPKVDYEVALDAMRVDGSDFFCGLTFPVKDSFCSLILGGWGGAVVGLSSIDGEDASENQTTQYMKFDKGRWYRVRVRVTGEKIQVWLDENNVIDLVLEDRKISLRYGDIERSKPLGIATWQTTGAVRQIKLRRLGEADTQKK
jgi:hypothetical protein